MPYGGLGNTIVLIILLLLVIFAAYFTTRFLSSKTKNLTKCKYILVKDRMFLGRDKNILLIEVGDQDYLVGVTNQSIQVIGTIEKDKITPVTEEAQVDSVFSGLKNIAIKISGAVKKGASAQEELRKARMQYKNEKAAPKSADKQEEDDIEKILSAIDRRKSRMTDSKDNSGEDE